MNTTERAGARGRGHGRTSSDVGDEHARELRKEALTMALYVAVCLLAALAALPRESHEHISIFGLVWGVTIGLALAHWFAFRVASQLAGGGTVRGHDLAAAGAQVGGAAVVALLATVAVVLTPEPAEARVVSYVLAGAIGTVGFAVARTAGARPVRAVLYAAVVLVLALVVVALKNALAGH